MIRANQLIAMRGIRGLTGLIGVLLITIGAVLMLFVGWQLFWTDVVSDPDSGQVVSTIEQDPTRPEWVEPKQAKVGDAFAIVRIPRFGTDSHVRCTRARRGTC